MFAERYIQNNVVYPAFISEKPVKNLWAVVMIPCLKEPEIIRTLESLWSCAPVELPLEVLVVVNESEASSTEVKDFNLKTLDDLWRWKGKNDRTKMILRPVHASDVPARHAGAGMARKIGMDEAIRRFALIDKPDGIIISLDSDCLVSENYLQRIADYFSADRNHFAATLNFRHRVEEVVDERLKRGIRMYEDYLHYYKKAHDFAGFPNSIYTIGSAFAVRADAYVKQGGMNRRQAGEDFYFLNKLTDLGKVDEIADAFVYPSARVSDRVPFGTGAAMTKWMGDEGDLTHTYNFSAFQDLKSLFDFAGKFYRATSEQLNEIMIGLPVSIQEYSNLISFVPKVQEINQNSSSEPAFRKRFFQFFDAFVIMRFLNLSHPAFYPRQDLYEAIVQMESQRK